MANFPSNDEEQPLIVVIQRGILFLTSMASSALAFLLQTIYALFLRLAFSNQFQDKEGNSIPNGPIGLPVVGKFGDFDLSL